MTFLELCQSLREECSVAGVGPVSVKGQGGEYARLVSWIRQANTDIQMQFFNWKFLWRKLDLTFKTGESLIARPSDLCVWRYDTLWIDGVQKDMVEHQGTNRYDTCCWEQDIALVMPDDSIRLIEPVKKDCTGRIEYFSRPQRLHDDSDEPWIPEPYQMAIVYRAMMKYANYENAMELKTAAMEGYQTIMPRLLDNQLPNHQNAGGMANDYDLVVRAV